MPGFHMATDSCGVTAARFRLVTHDRDILDIAAPAEKVFDFVVDVRNERDCTNSGPESPYRHASTMRTLHGSRAEDVDLDGAVAEAR